MKTRMAVLAEWDLVTPLEVVCKRERTSLEAVMRGEQTKTVCRARRACYATLREMRMSLPEIGKLLGVDHTSVAKGLRKYHAELAAQAPSSGEEVSPSNGAAVVSSSPNERSATTAGGSPKKSNGSVKKAPMKGTVA